MATSTEQVLSIIEKVLTVLIPVGVLVGKHAGLPPQAAAAMAVLVPLARELKDIHTEMKDREAHKVLPSDKDWAIQNERFQLATEALQAQIMHMVELPVQEEKPEPKKIEISHTDKFGVSD